MNFFTARQPILDRNREVIAYELLFRDSLDNVFPDIDQNAATAKMIEGLQLNLGLSSLARDKLAFINFTEHSLLKGYPKLLPKEQVVIEILENVRPTRSTLNACIELHKLGYTIALDDYEHDPAWQHFFPYIHIIKADLKCSNEEEIKRIATFKKKYPNLQLLAEKVETYDEFECALELGYTLFQGYFFSRPEIVQSVALNPSQLSLTRLMAETAKPEPDVGVLTQAIERDVNLSYKLLKYVQSPLFKRSQDIDSIKKAIVILGNLELQRFVSLLFTAQFSNQKPQELHVLAHTRANFCEALSKLKGQMQMRSSAYLVGLLSLLDAMLDADFEPLITSLSLSQEITAALLKEMGEMADYLLLAKSFEQGEWDSVQQIAQSLSLTLEQANLCYYEAVISATDGLEHRQ